MSQGVHLRKYGVETTIDFELYEVDGVNLRVDWVPAAADCEVMKDEGASTGCTNTATDEGSTYSIVLTATEMQAARLVLKVVDAATKAFLDKIIIIETYGNASAMHAQDLDQTLEAGADAALVTRKLDHLVSAAESDDVADNSIIAKMVDAGGTADWTDFINSEDSLRAISEAVAAIGSSTGGGFNFAPVSDDVLEDTINDAAAVDKSTTPATVGIPVTGAVTAGWIAGDECTIAGSTNYEGQHVIDSVTTNEIVIVSSFTAETFSSDTIKRTIKATRLVGTQDGGTFASVAGQDLVYHIIGDDTNNFTISYRYAIGGGRRGVGVDFTGYLNSNNDTALIQAYDFVNSAWETRSTFDGQNGTVNQVHNAKLLARNTGTSGVELGQVLIRIKQGAASSSPTLNIDELVVEGVGVAILGLHENGSIWVDTTNGVNGTEEGVNGTSDNPCKTFAEVQTMLTATARHNVHVINGSSITLDASLTNISFFGDEWTLALGGQAINNCHIAGATVSGTSTGTGNSFHGGEVGTCTLAGPFHIDNSILSGTITVDASEFEIEHCTMSGTPVLKFTGGSTTGHLHDWHGQITLEDMGDSATDVLHIDGAGSITTSSCAGGTVHYRGEFKITDVAGNTTFNASDQRVDVVATLVDTGTTIPGTLGSAADTDMSTDIANIKARVDALLDTAGIIKNTAINNFPFLMIDSSDDISPKTGLTITAERSIDGGAFTSMANSAAEISDGWYKINLAQADTNGDLIAYRFTSAGANDSGVSFRTTST